MSGKQVLVIWQGFDEDAKGYYVAMSNAEYERYKKAHLRFLGEHMSNDIQDVLTEIYTRISPTKRGADKKWKGVVCTWAKMHVEEWEFPCDAVILAGVLP